MTARHPMRVAALYDIHANLPALEAVLEDVRSAQVDEIVVGGDVFPGPMPRETLDLLLGLDVPVRYILGNGDRAVCEVMAGREPADVPEPFRETVRWTARQLDAARGRAMGAWPQTVRMEIGGVGTVLFCHATPGSDTEIVTVLTAEDEFARAFGGHGAALVVCGHTHMHFDRMVAGTRVVNAGSVGMPFGEPGADWLLLGPGVHPRHTAYDLASAATRIRSTGYPEAEHFATRNVLHPPSAREMLGAFTRTTST